MSKKIPKKLVYSNIAILGVTTVSMTLNVSDADASTDDNQVKTAEIVKKEIRGEY